MATHADRNLPTPNGSLGRDLTSGRFTTGNPGGPGNPYARRVAAMRTQLLDAVDSDGIAEVARALLAAAKAGDTAAARLVLSYAVGPPLTAADPDRLDANELEALRSRPNMFDRFALSNLTPEPMSLFRDEGI
ncbi:MAG: hypothetical protein O2884_14740 [Chloroflexi bacterium]|nr:hypothetical protein [Chloroflexota bacterium]